MGHHRFLWCWHTDLHVCVSGCVCEREGEAQPHLKSMEMGPSAALHHLVVWELRAQLAILKSLGADLAS